MLSFKIADQEWEFTEIHKLNYETFVEEIPQHRGNSQKHLVDKFHEENDYIICVRGECLVGMIAVRDKRPFSLDGKLDNLEDLLPAHSSICELRLLSIKKNDRNRKVIQGLFKYLAEYCEDKKYDLAVVSATTTQSRLYKTLGFKPFGPLVGSDGAEYQPMFLTPSSYFNFRNSTRLLNGSQKSGINAEKILLQPGPVRLKEEVKAEFKKDPVSHRSEEFAALLGNTKKKLCDFTNARYSQILMGSGTLSNDHVAAQLSSLGGRGLILANGEFGERLVDHAGRFNLLFDTVEADWGDGFRYREIKNQTEDNSYDWLWFVHCETSTGILNDIEMLKEICSAKEIKLCADCISSLGSVNTDLSGVYLATSASGKGLASYPGISFVFHNAEIYKNPSIPRYLDTGSYFEAEAVPYTLSSNLLRALNKSLELIDTEKNMDFAYACSELIRERIKKMGVEIINDKEISIPSVITFRIDSNMSSLSVGESLEKKNIYLSYRSSYLVRRNLMQFVLMGGFTYGDVNISLNELDKILSVNKP